MHVHVEHDSRETFCARERTGLLTVAMSQFVIVAFMRFLVTTREGVTGRRCDDPSLRFSAPEVDLPQINRMGTFDSPSTHPTGSFFATEDHYGHHISLRNLRWSPVAALIPGGAYWPSKALKNRLGDRHEQG